MGHNYLTILTKMANQPIVWFPTSGVHILHALPTVLGSEKIRLMERKMNIEILGSAYSPTKTLQNKFCWMEIGQSSQKIQSIEVESQQST